MVKKYKKELIKAYKIKNVPKLDRPLITKLCFLCRSHRMVGFAKLNQLLNWYFGHRVFCKHEPPSYAESSKPYYSALDPLYIAKKDQNGKWIEKIDSTFSFDIDDLRMEYKSIRNDSKSFYIPSTFEDYMKRFLYHGAFGLYTKKTNAIKFIERNDIKYFAYCQVRRLEIEDISWKNLQIDSFLEKIGSSEKVVEYLFGV